MRRTGDFLRAVVVARDRRARGEECNRNPQFGFGNQRTPRTECTGYQPLVGLDNLLSGRPQRAGSDALSSGLRFLWLRFAMPPGQRVVRANQTRAFGYSMLFAITFAATMLSAHAAKPAAEPTFVAAPKYFFNIDLDPWYHFTGTGELTEEQAQKANCYRFHYDADGKLAQIEYLRAGKGAADPVYNVSQIDFDHAPGIERRWFGDHRGNPKKNSDGVFGEELALDGHDVITTITNLDDSGAHMRDDNGVVQYVRTPDAVGRVLSSKRIGLFGTNITDDSGFFERRWKYDPTGQVIEIGNYDDKGELLDNNDGVALIRKTSTFYPDSTQTIESYFDSSSLAAGEKSTGVHQRQRTFDKRGFLIDEAYFDSTGAPTTYVEPSVGDTRVHERKLTIDDLGNIVEEQFFDVTGHPVDERGPEIARIDYKYNPENRVSEELFYGDDGKPQINPQVGAAMVRQEYNDQGLIVHQMFFDGQGHPAQHARYQAAAIRIKVDGDTTCVSLFDDKDQPTKNPVNGYSSFTYKTAGDYPLSLTNKYYDLRGREMTIIRERIIFPHLHALREPANRSMKWSARLGALGAGLGAILGAFIALRKSSHTKRRKVWVPTPLERFLGWFSVFAILEGSLRFFMTLYWAWIDYLYGNMGWGFNALETVFILFFVYRLYRMTVTMRVLNIEREDMHKLVRDFFAKAGLKAEWVEAHHRYLSPPLDVSVKYFKQKFHAYLSFVHRGAKGKELQREFAAYIRAQTGGILGPVRTKWIAFYYPCVAVGYFVLAGVAFYTLFQLVKGYS
jgi:hypothetical protein